MPGSTNVTVRIVNKLTGVDYKTRDYTSMTGAVPSGANGMPVPTQAGRRTLMVDADGPGFLRLTVMDAKGAIDSVMVRLQ